MQWFGRIRHATRLGMALTGIVLACGAGVTAGEPRLNQIQVIGSHNSYHIAPAPEIQQLIGSAGKARAEGLDYTHRPFDEQFSKLGIRQIELDVFADPKGGMFADPYLRKILTKRGKDPGPDPNSDGKLDKPGFKVLHVQDVEFRTHAPTFVEGLKQVKAWSKENRRHVPILILVELKDDSILGAADQAHQIRTRATRRGRCRDPLGLRQVGDPHADRVRVSSPPCPRRSRPKVGRHRRGPRPRHVRDGQRRRPCESDTSRGTRRSRTASCSRRSPQARRGRLVQNQRPDQGLRQDPEARPRRLPRPHPRRCRYGPGPGQRHQAAREGAGQRA